MDKIQREILKNVASNLLRDLGDSPYAGYCNIEVSVSPLQTTLEVSNGEIGSYLLLYQHDDILSLTMGEHHGDTAPSIFLEDITVGWLDRKPEPEEWMKYRNFCVRILTATALRFFDQGIFPVDVNELRYDYDSFV